MHGARRRDDQQGDSGRRVAAIIPVHVFGTSVDMDPILELAREYHLAVVEDASESLGSLYKGRKCGGLAPIGCLSFNGNKIVTTGGGGAILTNDETVARQARYLTTQAKEDGVEYIHNSIGYNYRMNNVLAALGLAQLETLEERIATKRANFALYEQALGPERLVQQPSWSEANRWFYGYLCSDAGAKARLMAACAAADIQVRPLWYPNHLQRPYRAMQAYQITNAPRFYDTLLNLPCSLSLTPEQIAQVVAIIEQVDPRVPDPAGLIPRAGAGDARADAIGPYRSDSDPVLRSLSEAPESAEAVRGRASTPPPVGPLPGRIPGRRQSRRHGHCAWSAVSSWGGSWPLPPWVSSPASGSRSATRRSPNSASSTG